MRSLFDDDAAIEHEDLVGRSNRRKAVRDDEHGPPAHELLHRILDDGLALAVEAGRRLVEQKDGRIGEDGTRNGYTLALTSGELEAPFADDRIEPVR
jgi:hypothetical protein